METEAKKQTIFSAAQPSGNLTIGNYLGAIKNWVDLQDKFDCIYCVADMHAITVKQEPALLRRRTLETMAIYIACGVDPEKVVLFVQSQVPAHAELSWVLSCNTMFGELSRMTQFKDKSAKNTGNVNAGLFTYPVLMAADILLYNTDLVPVGADQKQHIEIARTIAQRFNSAYSPTFTMPREYVTKEGTKIMSLQEPEKKMSKSDPNPLAYISLLDSRDDIIKKFKKAVTDCEALVKYDEARPGITNLINLYSCFTGKTVAEIEREFDGRGYGDFKLAVGEACADMLDGVQHRYKEIVDDKAYLEDIMKKGAEAASRIAYKTLAKVYRKVGFYPQPR